MEKPRWPHGWIDNQWGAGHASQRRLHRGVQARGVARDLRLWGRVHAPGDQVCSAERQTGKWEGAWWIPETWGFTAFCVFWY